VYTISVRNITLSADEDLIERARLAARAQRKSLNDAFREWLLQFTAQSGDVQELDALLVQLRHVRAGRRVPAPPSPWPKKVRPRGGGARPSPGRAQ
jgi:hypothetical protein